MKYTRFLQIPKRFVRSVASALILLFLSAGILLPPAMGDCNPTPRIIRELPRYSGGWSGGVTWYNGKIYEVTGANNCAYIKNPYTGVEEGRINFGSWAANDINDITYDRFRGTFWVKVREYAYEVPVTGGDWISRFDVRNKGQGMAFGIYKDPDEEHVMWVADPVQPQIRKTDIRDGSVVKYITTTFNVRGIARAGNTLWCVRAGELGMEGVVFQVDMSGNTLCRYNLPDEGYTHDAGGCDIDPDGYLWIEGGKNTAIYQLDIGYHPTTPTPAPSPTPMSSPTAFTLLPIIDSGDYDGDGTSDTAIFRPSTGFWAVRGVTKFNFGRRGDIPASGDYTGDGTTNIAIFRPSNSFWAIRGVTRTTFGIADDIPVPGDYTGNGTCDIAIHRRSNGLWAIRTATRIYFGAKNFYPVPGYYTGSRSKDLAVFRPTTGLWSIRGLTQTYFGQYGDIPAPADYNGAGRDEIAVYRPGTGIWMVRNLTRFHLNHGSGRPQPADFPGLGLSVPAVFSPASGLWRFRGDTRFYFGRRGDVPVAGPPSRAGRWRMPIIDSGDYNGDGTPDVAIFRDTAGLWAIRTLTRVNFGRKGDIPVSGDYNGSGRTNLAIYRPLSGLWSVRHVTRFYYGGAAGDIPAPGDYNGDGTCDVAVFNKWTGRWRVRIEIPFSSRSTVRAIFGEDVEVTEEFGGEDDPGKSLGSTAPFTYEFVYGKTGDLPVPGYYSGGSSKMIAIFRPSTSFWAIRGLGRFTFGRQGDLPLTGDFTGDGTEEVGIYRPSTSRWGIRGGGRFTYGRTGDIPVPGGYAGGPQAIPAIFRPPRHGLWAAREVTRFYFGQPGDSPVVGGRVGVAAR